MKKLLLIALLIVGCKQPIVPENCDSDLVCGEALTCCDGFLYPTTCCANNCDENIGTCN